MKILALTLMVLLAGCSMFPARTVATDVQTIDRPLPVKCRIEWPVLPKPYVAMVQLTGNGYQDAILIWRALEAEIEERIAYQEKLEAAARVCLDALT